MKLNKAPEMLGFVPQFNLHITHCGLLDLRNIAIQIPGLFINKHQDLSNGFVQDRHEKNQRNQWILW